MKFLKRFNEADEHQMSWAGSLYANKNPMVVKYPETFPIPQKETELYKCNKCGIERRYFNDEKLQCKRCNSEDLEKEIDSLE